GLRNELRCGLLERRELSIKSALGQSRVYFHCGRNGVIELQQRRMAEIRFVVRKEDRRAHRILLGVTSAPGAWWPPGGSAMILKVWRRRRPIRGSWRRSDLCPTQAVRIAKPNHQD